MVSDLPLFVPVQSSNVDSISYDVEKQELYVQFRGGSIYVYYNVPEDVYLDFLTSPSKGQFLNSNVKDVYSYQRIQ